jgi:hypothetical protein
MGINVGELPVEQQITAIYVAYFDRAPDPAGLQYWIDQYNAGQPLAEIAENFARGAEAVLKYPYLATPDVASPETFITNIYVNLFNRMPDAEGLAYWAAELADGYPIGKMVLAILNGAQSEAEGGFPDSETITNKLEVGLDWAQAAAELGVGTPGNLIAADVDGELEVYDPDSFVSATTILDGVTGDEGSVTDAQAAIAEYFEQGLIGETINLTTTLDEVEINTPNTIDTVRGIIDGTDNTTFTSGDTIKGNGLTEVQVVLVDGTSPSFVEMEGVNALEFRAAGETSAVEFDASSYGTDLNNFTLFGADGAEVLVGNVEFDEGALTFEIEEGTEGALGVADGTGALTGSTQVVYLSTTGSEGARVISDIGGAGVDIYAGSDAYAEQILFDYDQATSSDASIEGISVGDVNMMAGDDATAYQYISRSADVSATGDASVGDMTVGDVSLAAVGDNASVTYYNYAYARADDGMASIGDWTVGDVSVSVGDDAFAYYSDYLYADAATTGDAVIGDSTYGNIHLSAADGHQYASIYHYANADADKGDATIGDLLVGDISFTIGDDGTGRNYISFTRDAEVNVAGDASIGDLTVGNIAGSVGDDSALEFYFENEADADSGDATVGNITVGDISMTLGKDAYVSVSVDNDVDVDDAGGTAKVGNVAIGNIDLTMLSGASFEYYVNNFADAVTDAAAVVGDTTVGDITAVMGLDAYLSIEVTADAENNGDGTDVSIGNVSVGDVSLMSDPAGLNASAYFDVTVDSDGTIGTVTVGNVDVHFLSDSTFDYNVDISAGTSYNSAVGAVNLGDVDIVAENITYEVDVLGDLTAGVAIGDVMLSGDSINFQEISIYASADIGDVTIGNVMLSAATNLTVDTGISIFATGDVGNVSIGDVSIDFVNDETFYINVAASDDIGDVSVGDIDLTASASTADIYGSFGIQIDGDQDVGNVIVGDVSILSSGKGSNYGSGYFTMAVDAGTGDDIGNVTIGDIDLKSVALGFDTGSSGVYGSFSATIGGDADSVGDIAVGNITLTATAENVAADADSDSDEASPYVGIYADQGSTVSSMLVGDIDITLTNSVDDSTAFTAGQNYNRAQAYVYVSSDSEITVGDINLTAVNDSTVDVQAGVGVGDGLFDATIRLSADAGVDDITVGDITVSGGDVDTSGNILDNLATLTSWLTTNGDTVTVGDIDYSGYEAEASIDVSGFAGAANISAASDDTTITVNDTQNTVTLGDGDDTVVYIAEEDSGATYADIDKISGFSSGDDTIDLSAFGLGGTAAIGGTVLDYDTFLTTAQSAMTFDDYDVFTMTDGVNTYVAINSDDDASEIIDFVIELTGVTTVTTGDFTL